MATATPSTRQTLPLRHPRSPTISAAVVLSGPGRVVSEPDDGSSGRSGRCRPSGLHTGCSVEADVEPSTRCELVRPFGSWNFLSRRGTRNAWPDRGSVGDGRLSAGGGG